MRGVRRSEHRKKLAGQVGSVYMNPKAIITERLPGNVRAAARGLRRIAR